jgi:hypothetical protein
MASGSRSLVPSVRASQTTSATSVSELYYGPSSNFSLMQQLYRQLGHDGGRLPPQSGDVQDAGDGLDEVHYRNVCFHSQLPKLAQPDHSHLPMDHSRYLDAYFETISVLFPVIEEEDLKNWLSQWQESDCMNLDPVRRAVLLAALAVGALFCNAKDEGEGLLQVAQKIADESRQIINTEVVILNFLMISRSLYFERPLLSFQSTLCFTIVPVDTTWPTSRTGTHVVWSVLLVFTRHRLEFQTVRPFLRLAIPSTALSLDRKGGNMSSSTCFPMANLIFVSFLCTSLGRPAALQSEEIRITEPHGYLIVMSAFDT